MSLENVLRGSGDIGAMLATAWGVRQIDPRSNRVFVANLKARDFEPCEPFIIEGRPHLDEGGHFKLVAKPGEAGELRDHLNRKQEKKQLAIEMHASGKSVREIAAALQVSKSSVSRWLPDAGMEHVQ
jgi:DNA-binding NarL/FixJ family response regulator